MPWVLVLSEVSWVCCTAAFGQKMSKSVCCLHAVAAMTLMQENKKRLGMYVAI